MKASVVNRVFAKAIDLTLVWLCAWALPVPYPIGPAIGFLYSLGADSIRFGSGQSQSIGKRIMKLQTVSQIRHTETGLREPANLKESIYRNAPVGVATFFALIPFWGWLIMILIGIPLMVMEVYLMLSVAQGHRLGDVMGDTEVIPSSAA